MDIHDCGYTWVQMNAGKKDGKTKSEILRQVRAAFSKSDAVGSFNSHASKVWGSFLVKGDEIEHALKKVEREFMGVDFIRLNRINDSGMI